MHTVITTSNAETAELGARLGRLLRPGDFIALVGELGAGKTQFAKGIATGLDVDADTPVTSPTYTILNIYQGRVPLYHFDLYRLESAEQVEELGFDEYFAGDGACVVEWAERLGDEVPAQALIVSFAHAGGDERSICFTPSGVRGRALLEHLFSLPPAPDSAGF
ncbi:tRNA (adenosine(37)-N6)-threonylcarbamoyltransferase complex ATPase subunit type 1 TsaE [Geomonas sp.]|uniref:tRNA (adenosine(37)-N6)-threonylcarbamoyltransferase complex ATPase subunit type 1 TsaE n=1 Tax=Geomonas sp. TaxID=2651584 RepID=UPI002B48FD85|nr:tRNA (adenosine(37)-N6)-threonylcarbamoyltransferase complex ATPase subunit type 1 TsaE [Geomonas sp.]HJV36536.1 tRNA (adenosine(37)-N6)-threonylcarbamoyltransferase complex ATPase subunit type 1 TsaE [Geomonas sp.]